MVPLKRDGSWTKHGAPVGSHEIKVHGTRVHTAETTRTDTSTLWFEAWHSDGDMNKLMWAKMTKLRATSLHDVTTVCDKDIEHGASRVGR